MLYLWLYCIGLDCIGFRKRTPREAFHYSCSSVLLISLLAQNGLFIRNTKSRFEMKRTVDGKLLFGLALCLQHNSYCGDGTCARRIGRSKPLRTNHELFVNACTTSPKQDRNKRKMIVLYTRVDCNFVFY